MHRDTRDWTRLITTLRGLDRIDVAQFMAQAIDEMLGDEIPTDEIADICASIFQRLGVEAEDLRRALN